MAYSAITKSTDYFDTKLYTGNNSSSHAITGVGFQPDFTWIKGRNLAESHRAYDVVRGPANYITPNASNIGGSSISLTSFNSDGFTIGTNDGSVNGNYNYVSWNWKAGGAGSANSDGSVASTVSANTTSGFSVVKYTNPSSGSPFTVGHGLGAAPKMIMIKNITGSSQNWGVWSEPLGFGKYIQLNTTIAEATANLVTATSSTTFSTYYDHHVSGVDLIAYCFADVKGFSKVSSYVGNGSNDGPFNYTGFKPAMIIFKIYSGGTGSWVMYDNKRNTFNVVNSALFPDLSNAEETADNGFECEVDMLSNGFKLRGTGNAYWMNQSGWNYTYIAFAENPFTANVDGGLPTTAR